MVKGVDDTLYVSPVSAVDIALVGFLLRVVSRIVSRVSVHKTVGHNKINDIGRCETLSHATTFTTVFYHVVNRGLLVALCESKSIVSCLADIDINKQVVLILCIMLTFEFLYPHCLHKLH